MFSLSPFSFGSLGLLLSALQGGAHDPATAELVGREMSLARHELVQLALPDVPVPHLEFALRLGERDLTVRLQPQTWRTRDFRVLVQGPGGALRDAPVPPVGTYRGSVREVEGSRVRAALVAGHWRIQLELGDESWGLQPLAELGPGALSTEYVAYRSSDVLPVEGTCESLANPARPTPSSGAAPEGAATPNTARIVEIAFDADFEYFQLNGGSVANTVADIESVMSGVNAIFRNDVDIVHLLSAIVVRTTSNDPYTQTDAAALLGEMQTQWNTQHASLPRDVAHLMTGKDLNGTTIGVAWLQSVCSDPASGVGYGLSQSRYSINAWQRVALTAHELGHNWGACHCDESPPGCQSISSTCCNISFPCRIMCSTIQGCDLDVTGFSGVPIFEITQFRNAATCLGPNGGVLYVDAGAGGLENGLRWADAFTDLRDALSYARPGEEVWVAAGAYTPDPGGGDRDATFLLPLGVELYGGFAGGETQRAQRDPAANPTVLSGVLAGGARSYNVVTADGVDAATVLDGFTVTGGLSDGSGLNLAGAGILVDGGSPVIRGCDFVGNASQLDGGAAYVLFAATPRFEGCRFVGNTAANGGGAIYHRGGAGTVVTGCSFEGNSARYGGAMYTEAAALVSNCLFFDNAAIDSAGGTSFGGAVVNVVANFFDGPTFVGCTLSRNTATGNAGSLGGGIYTFKSGSVGSSLTMKNCVLWANAQSGGNPACEQLCAATGPIGSYDLDNNCVQGGLGVFAGTGNISGDPQLIGPTTANFRLPVTSPCVDAGLNAAVPSGTTLDIEGKPRVFDGDGDFQAVVDMGCYELAPATQTSMTFP